MEGNLFDESYLASFRGLDTGPISWSRLLLLSTVSIILGTGTCDSPTA